MSLTVNADVRNQRAYRRRLVERGRLQFLTDLPRETLAFLDEIKERQGLRNRGQVLEQLIENRRVAAQQ